MSGRRRQPDPTRGPSRTPPAKVTSVETPLAPGVPLLEEPEHAPRSARYPAGRNWSISARERERRRRGRRQGAADGNDVVAGAGHRSEARATAHVVDPPRPRLRTCRRSRAPHAGWCGTGPAIAPGERHDPDLRGIERPRDAGRHAGTAVHAPVAPPRVSSCRRRRRSAAPAPVPAPPPPRHVARAAALAGGYHRTTASRRLQANIERERREAIGTRVRLRQDHRRSASSKKNDSQE